MAKAFKELTKPTVIDLNKTAKGQEKVRGEKARQFGETIRRLRRKLDLSQEELAEKLGIYRMLLARIEAGTATPSLDLISALASNLEIPACQLLILLGKCERRENPGFMEVAGDDEIQIKITGSGGRHLSEQDLELLKLVIRQLLDQPKDTGGQIA